MKILVTGGAGFQGSHVVEQCLLDGHQVTILSTFSEEAQSNLKSFEKEVSVVWGSVTDREIVEKTTRGQETVIHMAARINVDESIESPYSYLNTNILGTYNILEAVRQSGSHLIYSSSCEVYGSSSVSPISETADLRPHSPYAASKLAADRLCFTYWKTYDVHVTVVRPCNIYGPRQKGGKGGAVIPIFVERALLGEPLVVYGSGEQRREYMHVDDLAAAYKLVMERSDLQGEAINVGTNETPSIEEIATFIAQRLGASIKHGPARSGEVMGFYLNNEKAKGLGFSAKVPFWEGLERYISWRAAT